LSCRASFDLIFRKAGWIAGAVIGSLFAIAVIVAIIIICVKKSNGRQGRVIPNTQGGVNVVQTSSQQQQGIQMNHRK